LQVHSASAARPIPFRARQNSMARHTMLLECLFSCGNARCAAYSIFLIYIKVQRLQMHKRAGLGALSGVFVAVGAQA